MISASRLVSIVTPESAPIKRIIQEARDRAYLIDATCGRKTRAVINTDSGHIILSGLNTRTICGRIDKDYQAFYEDADEDIEEDDAE